MRPSAPIASDPNAVYRAAIAAFADNRVVVADDMNPIEAANAHYQESAFAQLQRLGSTRADSLNRIASTRDPGALRAVEQITAANTTPAQPPMRCPEAVNSAAYPAEPSRAQAALVDATAAPLVTAETIRQYLVAKGYVGTNMAVKTIQNRLATVNLSPATLLTALETLHALHHPVLAQLAVRDTERDRMIYRLVGIALNKSGFRPQIKAILRSANDNPNRLIAAMLNDQRSH